MVRIRMQRVGKPHMPHYRVVAIDSRKARDAAPLETLGHYHPQQGKDQLTIQTERLQYWLSKGAQPSDTLRTLLKGAKPQTSAAA